MCVWYGYGTAVDLDFVFCNHQRQQTRKKWTREKNTESEKEKCFPNTIQQPKQRMNVE